MLQPGARLGDRYTLREPVARGGMGEVWRADDEVLGRTVAVKVLLPDLSGDPGFAERFRTEARAMATLSDPNIVEVYDYGQTGSIAYIVMQFVPGEPLHAVLRRTGPLPPHQAMPLIAQAARALHQAHGRGIVHRDVKPGNLLLRPDGRLVLTDFGIARIVAADRLTAVGDILGTASYLAPEQVTGGTVGPATDVYALGVVAYECLSGRLPFVADTPIAVALLRTKEDPAPLPPGIADPVRHVVLRALARDPRQRWGTAAAMAAAASAAVGGAGAFLGSQGAGTAHGPGGPGGPGGLPVRGQVPRRPVGAAAPPRSGRLDLSRVETEPVRPDRRRRRVLVIAGVCVVALLAVVGWAFLTGVGEPERPAAAGTSSSTTLAAAAGTASISPSASPSPSPSPSAGPSPSSSTTTPPAAAPAPRTSTTTPAPPRTPGPNERAVPDMVGKNIVEATYMLSVMSLMWVTNDSSEQCVFAQSPPAGTIVPVNSTVALTKGPGSCPTV